jgi:FkbM family methyltransferase
VIRKLKNIVKKIIFKFIKPQIEVRYIQNTYSQAGEDAILSFLFADKKINSVSYLDIGTNDPDYCNNTYLLYKKGNRGVCIEADKTLIPIIKKVRPEDKVINAGVAVGEMKEADFYIFDVKGLNTFDKSEAEKRATYGTFKIMEVEMVPLITINQIIKDNFTTYPDFLSIDIEGLDLDVLRSLDFERYPIPVICAETCMYSENHIRLKDPKIEMFIISKGYEVYADTYINTIFVNRNWFNTIE